MKYLVTGATSGIGLSVVRQLSRAGHEVVATGQRPKTQLPVTFPDVQYVPLDLSAGRGAMEALVPALRQLDRAILCAGTGYYRRIEDENARDLERVLAVNFCSAVELCGIVYTPLRRANGRLALIGSVARRGSANMPVYAASKAALRGFSRSLQSEWQDRIRVSHFDPWATRTPMHERSGLLRPPAWPLVMDPADVAAAILWRIERGGRGVHSINPWTVAAMRLRTLLRPAA